MSDDDVEDYDPIKDDANRASRLAGSDKAKKLPAVAASAPKKHAGKSKGVSSGLSMDDDDDDVNDSIMSDDIDGEVDDEESFDDAGKGAKSAVKAASGRRVGGGAHAANARAGLAAGHASLGRRGVGAGLQTRHGRRDPQQTRYSGRAKPAAAPSSDQWGPDKAYVLLNVATQRYLAVHDGGELACEGTDASAKDASFVVTQQGDKFLLQCGVNGLYVSVNADGGLTGNATVGDDSEWELQPGGGSASDEWIFYHPAEREYMVADSDGVSLDPFPKEDGAHKWALRPAGSAAPAAGPSKARGLEDSASNRQGGSPKTRGLEDSAANKQGSAPGTRQRYPTDDTDNPDSPFAKSRLRNSSVAGGDAETKPGSGAGTRAQSLAQEVSLMGARSGSVGGRSKGAEEDEEAASIAGSVPPLNDAEDFDLAPKTKPFQRPSLLTTQMSHNSDTMALEASTNPAAAAGGAKAAAPMETLHGERIDVDDGGKPSDAAAARRKQFEADSAAREAAKHKQKHAITASDFASQDALNGVANVDKRTGLVLPSVLELFQTYDQDRTGAVNINEFKDMLIDLDGLKSVEEVPQKGKGKQTKQSKRDPEESPEDRYVRREFERADLNGDELISIDEFYIYFYSTLCFKFPMLRTGVNPGADLLNIYMKYCSFGKGHRSEEMDCSQFAKLCADSKLLNGKTVTKATCDIVWFRARAELENLQAFKRKQNEYITPKMLYPQFLFSLLYIAEKRRSGLQEVISRILQENSPLPMPSCADYLVLKNDGSPEQLEEFLERPRGLPRAPPNPMISNMAERLKKESDLAKTLRSGKYTDKPPAAAPSAPGDDAEADADASDDGNAAATPGRATHGGAAANVVHKTAPLSTGKNVVGTDKKKQWGLEPKQIVLSKRGLAALNDPETLLEVRKLKPDELIMGARDVFQKFNQWEGGTDKSSMNKTRFVKCIRDCQLISEAIGGLNQTLVDDYFAKVLPPAQDSVNFMRFIDALRLVATKLRMSLNAVLERLVLLGGPLGGIYEVSGGRPLRGEFKGDG